MDSCGYFIQLYLLCWTWLSSAWAWVSVQNPKHSGRYTRDVSECQTLVPRKVDADGAFQSFELPHFYDVEETRQRRAIATEEGAYVRYAVALDGREHVVELWPSHGFLAPALVVERRRRDLWRGARLSHARREQCHYVGRVHGVAESRAVLSACYDGLAGYVRVGHVRYFVEPAAEARPDASGRHLHVAFRGDVASRARTQRGDSVGIGSSCGVDKNWRHAWRDRFAWELQMNPGFPRMLPSPKSSMFVPRFVEVLVVLDKTFMDFHRDHDSENYVLTLMNIVSDYYHDVTLGWRLEIVVVRIMYLDREVEELDLVISPDAKKTLDSFKTWAQRINPVDPKHPNHHDIAVLFTCLDICADNSSNCKILGHASVAGVCQPHRSACVVEDSGLGTGLTIAHQIGHVMGCSHDGKRKLGDSDCEPIAPDGSSYIMATSTAPRTSVWSRCCRRYIETLLDSGMGDCLLDEPERRRYQGSVMPPGAMYDANYQCKDMVGAAEVCPTKQDEICRLLWCKTSPETCTAPGKPAADGTNCGEGKWCYGGECVPVERGPVAVDGAWGAWSAWSPCSRSCGAGVEFTKRACDNPAPQNSGRYCVGEHKRYRVCNVNPCDPERPSFREIQCSAFDDKPFNGKLYKWKPYIYSKNNECELVCFDGPFFATLAPFVRDGTRCLRGTHDMCVEGLCLRVGCDWVMGSSAVEDLCGECDGDGSQCRLVETLYDAPRGYRYVKIATVPAESYNVKVEESEPTENTIAVAIASGKKFLLNGNYTEYANGEYSFGNDVFGVYTHPEPEREVLAIKGPTFQELAIYVVFYAQSNPGVRVSYYERVNNTSYKPSFVWEFLEWGLCSSRCGGGLQVSEACCVEKKTGKVSSSFCNAITKPRRQHRECNQQDCMTRWHVGSWSSCSGCKNRPGQQFRTVECRRENSIINEEPVLVELSECKSLKPADRQVCHSDEQCKEGQIGEVWLTTSDMAT